MTSRRLKTVFTVTRLMTLVTPERLLGLVVLSIILLGTAAPYQVATAQAKTKAVNPFAYDSKVPFDLHEVSVNEKDGVVIQDVDYAGYTARHGRIKAYIVRPKDTGRHAGIVFFHWLGDEKSDRTEFLDEAVGLARQGTVSVLIQGYFPWTEAPKEALADRQQVIDQTIEARRALDLLLAQPKVDRRRIAYVGHDYGAMFGSLVSGVDKRVKAYVLMAALGNFSDWSLHYWPVTASKGEDVYRQAFVDLEPIHYVSSAAPAMLLFQFANTDKFIPKAAALGFFGAASVPKQIKWYEAQHDLNVEAARHDRVEWLREQLGLTRRVGM